MDATKYVPLLESVLDRGGMENISSRATARVPIVTFTQPTTELACDICINNTLALRNTNMLALYVFVGDREREMEGCGGM